MDQELAKYSLTLNDVLDAIHLVATRQFYQWEKLKLLCDKQLPSDICLVKIY